MDQTQQNRASSPETARSIVIIGGGRFARALARTFPERIAAVVARDPEAADAMRAVTPDLTVCSDLGPLDAGSFDTLWILTADRAISAAVEEAVRLREDWGGVTVLHSSGGTQLAALEPLARRGATVLALHPNVSLTGEEPIPRGLYWSVSPATEQAEEIARGLLDRLEPHLVRVADELRPLYHAAASAAANYSVALFATACALYERAGLDAGSARRIVASFMRASVERAAAQPAGEVITGPIVRGDTDVVQSQLEAVARHAREFLPGVLAMGELTAHLFADQEQWSAFFDRFRET